MIESVTMKPVGIIETPYEQPMETPVQSGFSPQQGTIIIFDEFAEGLDKIETFSHLILLTRLHKAAGEMLTETPMVDGGEAHGIFATRHMCRPNKIGFSIVKLIRRENSRLIVEGADLLNETPVLDIKPYIPAFDALPEASDGWLTATHIANIIHQSRNV